MILASLIRAGFDLPQVAPEARPPEGRAFLTGSRAYGTPRADSDWDLVVPVSEGLFRALREAFADPELDQLYGPGGGSAPIRVGDLNLILCVTAQAYEAWRTGTVQLIARRPVTREEAVEVFKGLGVGEPKEVNRG